MGRHQLKLIAGGLCRIEPLFDSKSEDSFPRSFDSESGKIKVKEILDHWPGTDCDYYKISTPSGSTLIIKRDRNVEIWEIARWFD